MTVPAVLLNEHQDWSQSKLKCVVCAAHTVTSEAFSSVHIQHVETTGICSAR